jgi:GxxExxY protein
VALTAPQYESILNDKIYYRQDLQLYSGNYTIDLIVEDLVVVEIKSVSGLTPVFEAQVLTYLRLTGKRLGLLINFNSRLLKDGIKRFAL